MIIFWVLHVKRNNFFPLSILFGSVWAVLLLAGPIALKAGDWHSDHDWYLGSFGGVGTHNNIGQIFEGDVNLADSYIVGIQVGQEITRYKNLIGVDWEAQVAKHFNLQDHFEFNVMFVPRWHWFPWDRYLDTSFAFANGLSYATDDPEIEVMKNDETSKLLHYFYFELDFRLPQYDTWSVFARIHHRSGVFGFFDGIHGGSNFFTAGVKYRF